MLVILNLRVAGIWTPLVGDTAFTLFPISVEPKASPTKLKLKNDQAFCCNIII